MLLLEKESEVSNLQIRLRNLFCCENLGLITILNNFSQSHKKFFLVERVMGKVFKKANGMVVILITERPENIRDNCIGLTVFIR